MAVFVGRHACQLVMGLWALLASVRIGSGHGQTLTPNPQGAPLEVTLKTDKVIYELRDSVTVNVTLKNVSGNPTYRYAVDWGESASLSLWLTNAVSGADVQQEFVPDALPPPPSSKNSVLELLPSQVSDTVFTATLAELGVLKGGKYRLVVSYHSPIAKNSSFGLPIWGRENGDIQSNPTIIQVGR